MSDKHEPDPEGGLYTEPQERLTRIAAAATEAIVTHPENGEDIRAAFMIRDERGGHGAALYGYPEGDEIGIDALADVVKHISILFKAAGVEMELKTVTRENPDTLLAEPGQAADQPKVELTVTADSPDTAMAELCRAVKQAVEGVADLDDTRLIMVLDLGLSSAVMHHGYPSHHAMAHGLFEAFQKVIATEGGHVAVIPIMESPN
jgi:hypothetical protein